MLYNIKQARSIIDDRFGLHYRIPLLIFFVRTYYTCTHFQLATVNRLLITYTTPPGIEWLFLFCFIKKLHVHKRRIDFYNYLFSSPVKKNKTTAIVAMFLHAFALLKLYL
jgi:hypothetical protein